MTGVGLAVTDYTVIKYPSCEMHVYSWTCGNKPEVRGARRDTLNGLHDLKWFRASVETLPFRDRTQKRPRIRAER